MTVGQKLKKLRVDHNLTQKDLADKLNVSFQTVSKWEIDENEPDINTLKELAKLYDCSIDYLLNEDDEEKKEEIVPVTKTVVIHQKELHVCEKCNKDIPEDDLVMEQVCVTHAHRGHSATYRQAYYHSACLANLKKERAEIERQRKAEKARRARKHSWGWGIAGGVVALGIALPAFLCNTQYVHPGLGVLYSALISYGIFSMLYCIISGSYIGEVFVWCACRTIKFPGLIFSWSLDGFAWLIGMKILFAVLGFLLGALFLFFAIALSATLGCVSFPFVLIHNINTNYEDSLID